MSEAVRLTDRGFEYIEFEDRYGEQSELQQSSLAEFEQPGTSAIWLGLKNKRMHLDRIRVEWMIERLQSWLDTGSFV